MDCPHSPLTQCCYCGQPGHITFECPFLQQQRSKAPIANSITTEKKDINALVAKLDDATSALARPGRATSP